MSIREVMNKYANFKTLGLKLPNDLKLPPALENMCCEVYNPGDEEMTFDSVHPDWHRMHFFGLPPSYWKKCICKPGEWVFLPHGMYNVTVPSGSQEIRAILNFGDTMFKGNKLPSRPDVKKVRVFR